MIRRAASPDAWFDALPPNIGKELRALRATILSSVPGVRETLDYGMPTYASPRGVVCALNAQRHYLAFYLMDAQVLRDHERELARFDCGKTCVRFRKQGELGPELVPNLEHVLGHLRAAAGLARWPAKRCNTPLVSAVVEAGGTVRPCFFKAPLGVIDGQVLEPQALKAVAELPSRDALRAQLVGAVQGPLAALVSVLNAPLRELAYVLSERGKGAGNPPAGPAASESDAPPAATPAPASLSNGQEPEAAAPPA